MYQHPLFFLGRFHHLGLGCNLLVASCHLSENESKAEKELLLVLHVVAHLPEQDEQTHVVFAGVFFSDLILFFLFVVFPFCFGDFKKRVMTNKMQQTTGAFNTTKNKQVEIGQEVIEAVAQPETVPKVNFVGGWL